MPDCRWPDQHEPGHERSVLDWSISGTDRRDDRLYSLEVQELYGRMLILLSFLYLYNPSYSKLLGAFKRAMRYKPINKLAKAKT